MDFHNHPQREVSKEVDVEDMGDNMLVPARKAHPLEVEDRESIPYEEEALGDDGDDDGAGA